MRIVHIGRPSRSRGTGEADLLLCVGAHFWVHCPRYRWDRIHSGTDSICDVDSGCRAPNYMEFLDVGCICLILSIGSGFLSGTIGAEWLPPLCSLLGKWKPPWFSSGFNCRKIQILNVK